MAFTAIHGIPVTLYETTATGTNALNETVYATQATTVYNVVVAPASEQEILDTLNITGRKAVYTLHIPKGDTHDWCNARVDFVLNGVTRRCRTIGEPIEYIDDMVPLSWNKKVRCETLVEG